MDRGRANARHARALGAPVASDLDDLVGGAELDRELFVVFGGRRREAAADKPVDTEIFGRGLSGADVGVHHVDKDFDAILEARLEVTHERHERLAGAEELEDLAVGVAGAALHGWRNPHPGAPGARTDSGLPW